MGGVAGWYTIYDFVTFMLMEHGMYGIVCNILTDLCGGENAEGKQLTGLAYWGVPGTGAVHFFLLPV